MNIPPEWEGPLVGRLAGKVVLSMTPHRARVLATAIWMADRTGWLDLLADDLSTAADQREDFTNDEPQRESVDQRPPPPTGRKAPVDGLAGPVEYPSPRAGSTPDETLFAALARDVEVESEVAQRLEAAASQAAFWSPSRQLPPLQSALRKQPNPRAMRKLWPRPVLRPPLPRPSGRPRPR